MLCTVMLGRLEVCCVSEPPGEGTCRRATCCGDLSSYSYEMRSLLVQNLLLPHHHQPERASIGKHVEGPTAKGEERLG